MNIRILFRNGCEFYFENIKGYEEKGKYLQVICNTGYKREFDFDDIDNYKIEGV